MNDSLRFLLFWTPRGLTILYILFLGLFALDVFGEGHTFWQTLVALFMHLIPNMVVLAILLLAWRWEWIGAVAFAGSGLLYIFWAWGRFHISAYIAISGPLFLVAALFLGGWIWRSQIRG
ncbi:MAG: hypothetical protein HKO65_17280 [Gemmatimonadetes bacterium]|nr:hypothetical protein [Gemmatimonadota bacterium]